MGPHRLRSGDLRRHQGGYCAEGPGFYVWDEDPREVSRFARDLARGAGAETRTPSALQPNPGDTPGGES